MKSNTDKCPFCKKKNLGYVGKSIYFHYSAESHSGYYHCERCGKEWYEIEKITIKIKEKK